MTKPPESLLRSLERAPAGRPVSLLVRHAARGPIPAGSMGIEVDLTEEGVRSAEVLGTVLTHHRPGRLLTSPAPRCINTGRAIARGAGWTAEVDTDARLSGMGCFFVDGPSAWASFAAHGVRGTVRRQLSEEAPLPGLHSTVAGVTAFMKLVTRPEGAEPTLDVLVTHDVILAVLVGHFLKIPPDKANWPEFLEGLVIWPSTEGFVLVWRGEAIEIPWAAAGGAAR
jgi:broad specificity phosphatase PhoE